MYALTLVLEIFNMLMRIFFFLHYILKLVKDNLKLLNSLKIFFIWSYFSISVLEDDSVHYRTKVKNYRHINACFVSWILCWITSFVLQVYEFPHFTCFYISRESPHNFKKRFLMAWIVSSTKYICWTPDLQHLRMWPSLETVF